MVVDLFIQKIGIIIETLFKITIYEVATLNPVIPVVG